MKKINLDNYGPIISDKEIGKIIFDLISDQLKVGEKVIINMESIKSMATFCAKQIFGKLYITLGAAEFFERIELSNVTDDVKIIIKIGIQNAIEENTSR